MPETEELVINTGPLLALIAGIGDLSLLELLYKRVLVPFEVCQEIEAGGPSDFGVSEFRRSSFIEKRSNPLTITPFLRNALDLGEASVIQLALDENIHTAKKDGFGFSMREAISRMESQGIYLSQKVVDFALKQVNEM